MKTKIQISSIKSLWVPPFSKDTTTEEIEVKVGKQFHNDKNTKGKVFELLDAKATYMVLSYDNRFHLKAATQGIETVTFNGVKALKIPVGREVSFSHMWGDYGITKKITYLAPIIEE